MKRNQVLFAMALFVLASVLIAQGSLPAAADPGRGAPDAGYEMAWYTVDGGGATFSAGGVYSLGGTIGQPDPGLLAGGDYNLGGGFWGGGAPAEGLHRIYLPLVMRNYSP